MNSESQIFLTKRLTFLILCLMTALAMFMRMEYIQTTVIPRPIVADARQYVLYGHNLCYHGTFSKELASGEPRPDAFRSPGYPLLIALGFVLGGKQGFYPVLLVFQAMLGALMVPLTFLLGRWILSSACWAMLAAFLVAISPHLIAMTGYLLTETLFSFVLLSALVCFSFALKTNRPFHFGLAGFCWGFAYLTNETALLLPFLFFVILFCHGFQSRHKDGKWKKTLRGMSVCIIVFSLFPIAWALRSRHLPPDAPKGGSRAIATMTHGTYIGFTHKDPGFKYFPYREDPMQPAFSSSLKNFVTIFGERFRQRPLRYLSWYVLEKPFYLWSWNILQGQGDVYVYPVKTSWYQTSVIANATRIAMKISHPLILTFALVGILLFFVTPMCSDERTGAFTHRSIFPVIIITVYYTLLYMVFASWPRYSIPLRPELYLLASWSMKILAEYLTERRKLAYERQ